MFFNKRTTTIWIIVQTVILTVCIVVSPTVYATQTTLPDTQTTVTTAQTTVTTTVTETTAVPTQTTMLVDTTTQTQHSTAASTTTDTTSATPTTTTTAAPIDVPDTMTDEEKDHVLQLHQQRLELQQQADDLEQNRKFYADTLDGLLKQQESIEQEITLKQKEIDINAQIKDAIQLQMNVNDEELMAQEHARLVRRQELLKRYDNLREKLQAISKIGDLSVYLSFLDAETYTDLLITQKVIDRLSSADNAAMLQLQQEIDEIIKEKQLLEKRQALLDEQLSPYVSAEQSLETSQRELLHLLAESEKIADDLSQYISYYQTEYSRLYAEQSALRAQINTILSDIDFTNGLYAAEHMSWPTPGCKVITSSFKARWGRWHYGTDIASWGESTGQPIYAAADGTVIFAGGDPGTGYGYYIMVDHGYDLDGNRIITLYGHCSELYVQVGDVVFGGQSHIAAVGNTGNSFGAHLHFEVRVNGSAVDAVEKGYLPTDGITIAG